MDLSYSPTHAWRSRSRAAQVAALVKARDAARRRKKDKPSTTASTTPDTAGDGDVQSGDGPNGNGNGNGNNTLEPNPAPGVRKGVDREHGQERQEGQEGQDRSRRGVGYAATNESGASDRQESTRSTLGTPGSNGGSRAGRAAVINPYARKTSNAIRDTRPSLPVHGPETAVNGKASTSATKGRPEPQSRKRKAEVGSFHFPISWLFRPMHAFCPETATSDF